MVLSDILLRKEDSAAIEKTQVFLENGGGARHFAVAVRFW
jgi:hypothetical protein